MFPYIHVPDIGSYVHPFGLLVSIGVILGTYLANWRARIRGLDLDKLNSFITWMLVCGFIGAHVFDEIFYHPKEIIERPWSLLMFWASLSSFGGFLGALIGVLGWKYFEALPLFRVGPLFTIPKFRRRAVSESILPYCDLILSVFPVAWVFGRSGCTVAHDHPGMKVPMGTFLSVAYGKWDPAKTQHIGPIELRWGNAPQYDLGLMELLFTIVIATLFALTWRKRLTTGTYIVLTAFTYGPVRLVMDFIRIKDGDSADLRYGNLTFAQYCCLALVLYGVAMVFMVRKFQREGSDPVNRLLAPKSELLGEAPEPPPPPPVVAA